MTKLENSTDVTLEYRPVDDENGLLGVVSPDSIERDEFLAAHPVKRAAVVALLGLITSGISLATAAQEGRTARLVVSSQEANKLLKQI